MLHLATKAHSTVSMTCEAGPKLKSVENKCEIKVL